MADDGGVGGAGERIAGDARAAIERALDSRIDDELLNRLFENVLMIEKTARGFCATCGRTVQVTVPDSKAVVSALTDLLVQAKGRPGQAEGGEEERHLSFINEIVLHSPEAMTFLRRVAAGELGDGLRAEVAAYLSKAGATFGPLEEAALDEEGPSAGTPVSRGEP
jgi:hypothetical protein